MTGRLLAMMGVFLLVAGCPASEPDQTEEPAPAVEEAEPAPESAEEPDPPEEPDRAEEPDVPEDPDAPQEPVDGEARLVWVAVEDGDQVVLVDLDAEEVVEEYETPGGPHNLTVAEDGTVAAALYGGTEVALIGEGDVTFVELGGTPHDVKPAGDRFVVANEAAQRIDVVGLDAQPGSSIELRAQPHDLAITSDDRRAWVTLNGTDELAVVDIDAAEVTEYLATGQAPHDILFSPEDRVWVTDWEGFVHVFTGEGELVDSIELGVEAHHLTFTPDGEEVWITDHGTHEVFVIDTQAVEVLEALPVPGAPHHVAVTPDGALAAVADHDNDTLVVYDVEAREQTATIPVGDGPHGVWAVPD